METLEQLNGFTVEGFKEWLNTRLRQQYDSEQEVRYRACDFRSLGVPFDETNTDCLIGLCRKLSPQAQENFKGGVNLLLCSAKCGDFPKEGMRDLLVLVSLLKINQAVSAFMPLFGEGVWGNEYPALLYDAASVAMGLDDEIAVLLEKRWQNPHDYD